MVWLGFPSCTCLVPLTTTTTTTHPTHTHAEVIEATVQAVRDGATRYTAVTGEAALRKAICDDLERRKGVKYAPEEIIVGNGAKQEVYQAVLALCRCVVGWRGVDNCRSIESIRICGAAAALRGSACTEKRPMH